MILTIIFNFRSVVTVLWFYGVFLILISERHTEILMDEIILFLGFASIIWGEEAEGSKVKHKIIIIKTGEELYYSLYFCLCFKFFMIKKGLSQDQSQRSYCGEK